MHLLVLSAFRPEWSHPRASAELGVSMHLLVLSAFRPGASGICRRRAPRSQCTFWCSVLSDTRRTPKRLSRQRVSMHLLVLSAFRRPFLTTIHSWLLGVSMHLLVLSAFRPCRPSRSSPRLPTVSMHLLVLSAFRPISAKRLWSFTNIRSQCTFWCSVLSDTNRRLPTTRI